MMKVGIDFDNTLIDYDRLFAAAARDFGWLVAPDASRAEVKALLLNEDGNDMRWQQLQTEVYSRYICLAQPYAGIKAFCERVIENGDNVVIISHKTRLSNYDRKTDLIEPAKQWLADQGFTGSNGFLANENIYFLETLAQKIQTVRLAGVDLFIDDLDKVLLDDAFPESALAVLFAERGHPELLTGSSWQEIAEFYEICRAIGIKAAASVAKGCKTLPRSIFELHAGGNNRLFKIDWPPQALIAKKNADGRRLENEYRALILMEPWRLNVPKGVFYDVEAGTLLETALNGKNISSPKDEDIIAAVDFLVTLDKSGGRNIDYPMASHYRDNLASYSENVEARLLGIKQQVSLLQGEARTAAGELMMDKLDGLWNIIRTRFWDRMATIGLDPAEKFPLEEMILSPSDFGFHNMLKADDGSLQVCDFEYFGWDDKAKLLADFFHHQGHQLTDRQRLLFIARARKKKLITHPVMQRLALVLDLIGIEWILIILNVLDTSRLRQKVEACRGNTEGGYLRQQIGKANVLLENYQQRVEDGCPFVSTAISAEQWELCNV